MWRSGRRVLAHRSASMRGSYFPTTCTVSGPYRMGTLTFPVVGGATKTAFSKSVPTGEWQSPIMAHRGERGIWQRRYWEHTIRDDRDMSTHLDYIHFNPVKHGLVAHPADWPHSSFRRCAANGLYPSGRLGGNGEPPETGEPR